jgi:hypothetical protein
MCFKAGLVWQGIFHDISKYGVRELYLGVKYFDMEKDVYAVERENNGISMSFMHHISRNKHHPEYWRDILDGKAKLIDMPTKYFVEMILDRIVSTKEVVGDSFTVDSPYNYFIEHAQEIAMPNILRQRTEKYLKMYSKLGEDEFLRRIKALIKDPIRNQM